MMPRTLTVDRCYLIVPVAWGRIAGVSRIGAGTGAVREFDIRLAHGSGDYRVFADL